MSISTERKAWSSKKRTMNLVLLALKTMYLRMTFHKKRSMLKIISSFQASKSKRKSSSTLIALLLKHLMKIIIHLESWWLWKKVTNSRFNSGKRSICHNKTTSMSIKIWPLWEGSVYELKKYINHLIKSNKECSNLLLLNRKNRKKRLRLKKITYR